MNSIEDIKNIFYINLDSRKDRKTHVEKQLKSIGIKNAKRFKAIELKNGAIGCSISHLKILEQAKENNLEHVLIVEDDITFLNPDLFINNLNKFLSIQKDFDVVLIAGNNMPPYQEIDDYCIQVTKCQTTTGYLVQNHYFDTLINNYKMGISLLMNAPEKHNLYAIDKHWFYLQTIHKWYLIIPLTVIQRPDYSNIEQKSTNYSKLMLSLNKDFLFT